MGKIIFVIVFVPHVSFLLYIVNNVRSLNVCMTFYYAIVDYHVLSPSSREAISSIADFIGCLTRSKTSFSIPRLMPETLTLRLVDFIYCA